MASALVLGCKAEHAKDSPAIQTGSATPPQATTATPAPMTTESTVRAVARNELCVTKGSIEASGAGKMSVTGAKMRAIVGAGSGDVVELRFTYKGKTAETAALGSGEVRTQLGLKLRAQNGCNVLYAMWRVEPKPGIVVQVKKNPGMSTHAECANGGYTTVKPAVSKAPPDLAVGSSHVLRGELAGDRLTVSIDGSPVWQGAVPPEALTFDGPAGIRSDNAAFDFDLQARLPGSATPCSGAHDQDGD